MMTLEQNKRKMYYSNLLTVAPGYVTDESGNLVVSYVTEDGIVIYEETGESVPIYSTPQEMYANISESGGESEAQEYGLSVSDYEAVLLFDKDKYPLKEGSLVWVDSPIENEYGGTEIEIDVDGENVKTNAPTKASADFIVKKTPKSLNFTKAILGAVEK